ncbi:MAG: aspartyl/asparaginyl beta-hydroxylase domain-containing protein [Sphingomicrobium sp.]
MNATQSLEAQADQAAAVGDFAAARALLEQALEGGGSSLELLAKLSAMRKASGDLRGALDALNRALVLSPLDFSALLSRALLLERLGDPKSGNEFGKALAQAPDESVIPAAMKPALDHARFAWSAHQALVEEDLKRAIPPDLGDFEQHNAERFIANWSRRTRTYHQEPTDFDYPGMPEYEVHDRTLFPALDGLEGRTDEIRGEFEALIAAEAAEMVPYIQYPQGVPLRQWEELNHNREWSAIHLLQNGARVEANARHCPATMRAIAALPQPHIPGASPNAMFSLLAPRTRIPAHSGVANVRLVCHLPLIVPPDCGFRVGETTREWRVGEAFVFDDTIEHEAWNDSDSLRVVLIVDLWAPALSDSERATIAAVIGAVGVSFGGA